ncbi:MAG TPA: HAD-IA family hydrolase [Candidatus Saccharimonadales bacterium]|nr:HAD-IA family hydrolase [Candidatus Saccharimonadales bacterium]
MNHYIPSRTKAVLFDFDDTLVGTIEACWALDKYVAHTWYDKDLTDAELQANWHLPLREMIPIIFGIESASVDQALERIIDCYPKYPKKLFPSVIPVLQALQAANIPVGVVSSTVRKTLEYDLGVFQLNDLIAYLQTQEDTPYHKPDSRVFDPASHWLKQLGVEKGDGVLYIGDGLHDMKAANAAGFHFIGVETGLVDANGFKEAGATSIHDLSILLADL